MDRNGLGGFATSTAGFIVIGLMLLAFSAGAARGADPGATENAKFDDAFHLTFTGGFWAASMNGSMEVGNLSGDFEGCFTDLIHDANYAFNPGLELNKGKWVFVFAMTYSKLSVDEELPTGNDLGLQSTIGAWELLIGYNVLHTELGNGMTLSLTPAAGAQITYADTKIDPELLPSQQDSVTFVDPVVAGRIVLGLTPKFDWRTEGLIGGFGVGSELTWGAGSYLDWKLSEKVALSIGYRAMYWDYELGVTDVDLTMHGPWIGLRWLMF